jgi:hypothetical protein
MSELAYEVDGMVPLKVYSAALDEIYALRRALAYEATVLNVHLDYKTFPKSRRRFAEEQRVRMTAAACGDRSRYSDVSSLSLRHAMDQVGASQTMTRHEWETQRFGSVVSAS